MTHIDQMRKSFIALSAAILLAPVLQAFTYTYRVALRDEYGLLLGHNTEAQWQVQVYDKTQGCYTHNSSAKYDVIPTTNGYNLLFDVGNGFGYDKIKEGDELTLNVFRKTAQGTIQFCKLEDALPKLGSYDGDAILPVSFAESAVDLYTGFTADAVKDMSDINTDISYAIWVAGLAEHFDDRWTDDDDDADGDGVSNIDECRAGTDPYGTIDGKGAMTTFAEADANYPMVARTDKLNCTIGTDGAVISVAFDWSSGHAYSIRWKNTLEEIGEDLALCTAGGEAIGTKYFTTLVEGEAYPTGKTTLYAAKPTPMGEEYYVGLAVDGNFCQWVKVKVDKPTDPEGSEDNPWKVGEIGHETEVTAWTNGTGKLVIEGAGVVASTPWAADAAGITELQVATGVTRLGGTMVTLPSLTSVNGLSMSAFSDAAVGAVKAAGFNAIAVENGTATLSVVICKAESLDKPEWKPVSTNDVPVKADTPAGFFIVASQVPSDLDLPPIVTVK